jgi:hypothetical protein
VLLHSVLKVFCLSFYLPHQTLKDPAITGQDREQSIIHLHRLVP